MKNTTFRKNHSEKEKTLNFPADSHKKFCKRCFIANKGRCPNTGWRFTLDNDCTL